MRPQRIQSGFSLTEVLLAVATLSVGMLFVGGTFVLGLHYSQLTTEQTLGALAAQEVHNMFQLVREDLDPGQLSSTTLHTDLAAMDHNLPPGYGWYPSISTDGVVPGPNQPYHGSVLIPTAALVSPTAPVTVLVSRWTQGGDQEPGLASTRVTITDREFIALADSTTAWFHHGAYIAEDGTGKVRRVFRTQGLDRRDGHSWQLEFPLDPNVYEEDFEMTIWMVRPPGGTGKSPCIYGDQIYGKPRPG